MNSQISISEAARRWGKSRTTIQAKIKSGELSLVQSGHVSAGQAKRIEITELLRVFGEPHDAQKYMTNAPQKASSVQVDLTNQLTSVQHELELVSQEVSKLKTELTIREEQIADFRGQISIKDDLIKRLQPVPLLEQLKKMWSK